MSINHMPEYESKSSLRLRLEDYLSFKENRNNIQAHPIGTQMKNYLNKFENQTTMGFPSGQSFGGTVGPVFGQNPAPLEQRPMGSMSQVPSSLVFNQPSSGAGQGQQSGLQLFNPGSNQPYGSNQYGQQGGQGGMSGGFMNPGLGFNKPAGSGPFQSTGLGFPGSNPLGGQSGMGQPGQQSGQPGLGLGLNTPGFQMNPGQSMPGLGSLFPSNQPQSTGFPGLSGNTGNLFDNKPSAFMGLGQPQSQSLNQLQPQSQQGAGNPGFLQFPGQSNIAQQPLGQPAANYPAGYPPLQLQPGQAGTLNYASQPTAAMGGPQGVINDLIPMLGKVQNGSFAIYCVPLSQNQTGENKQSLVHDFENQNREIEAAIQRMSLRPPSIPQRSYDRPSSTLYDAPPMQFSERDDFAFPDSPQFDTRDITNRRPQSHAQKFSFLRHPQSLSRFGAQTFSKNLSRTLVTDQPNDEPQLFVTVEYLDPEGTCSVFTERFRSNPSVADIVRFMMEKKKLLDDRDLPNLEYTFLQKKLTFVDRLKDAGFKDGEVLFITQKRSEAARPSGQSHPTLTKPGYIVRPSIQELRRLTLEEQSEVSDFSIRTQAVQIYFTQPVDVRDADLDKIFQLEDDCVEIYPKKNYPQGVPERGHGFNVPGKLIKFGAVPAPVKKLARVEERLREIAESQNLEFESLNPQTGDVTFAFSELH
jgi:hypothetical protein